MSQRQYGLLDQAIISFDRGLVTLFGRSAGQGERPNPATAATDNQPLSQAEQRLAEGLMRVNHAGEVSAQALYQGQGLTARDPQMRRSMQQSAAEEIDHLVWCEERLNELDGHTSYLNPVWYLGSFTMGVCAGFIGDRWSLGFIVETERQVVAHLQGHLQRLPEADGKSRAILEQMQEDEAHHATVALESGAAELPRVVKQAMGLCSKMMTATSYWV